MILWLTFSLFVLAFVSADDCPRGWIRMSAFPRCVTVSTFLTSFDGATDFCKVYGATLIGIHNAFENAEILALAKNATSNPTMWIGLSNEYSDDYYWQDGTDLTFTNFEPGYPVEKTKSCVTMNGAGRWSNRFECGQENAAGYICVLSSGKSSSTVYPTTTKLITTTTPAAPGFCRADVVFVFDLSTAVAVDADKEAQMDAVIDIVTNQWTVDSTAIRVAIAATGLDAPSTNIFEGTSGDADTDVENIRSIYMGMTAEDTALKDTVDILTDAYFDGDVDTPRADPVLLAFVIFSATTNAADVAAVGASSWWNKGPNANVTVFMAGIESSVDLSAASYPPTATTTVDFADATSVADFKNKVTAEICTTLYPTTFPTTFPTTPATTTSGVPKPCVADVIFVFDLSTAVAADTDKEAQMDVVEDIVYNQWTVDPAAIRVAIAETGLDTPLTYIFEDASGDAGTDVEGIRSMYSGMAAEDTALTDTVDILTAAYFDGNVDTPRGDPVPLAFVIFSATTNAADVAAVGASSWWSAGPSANVTVFMAGIESAVDLSAASYPSTATVKVDFTDPTSLADFKSKVTAEICK